MNKTIHYFWFGGAPKTELIERCIASWKKFFPDFEVKEWNESNFDVEQNEYIKEAYKNKKYAFVSDFARFQVLEEYGGLYFDTDVEVVADFHEFLEYPAFAARETPKYVSPGLVLWVAEPHNPLMKKMLDLYGGLSFYKEDGSLNLVTICAYFTDMLSEYGCKPGNVLQTCAGLTIFPVDYFCPFNDLTGVLNKTENTRAVHWYAKTWMDKKSRLRNKITRVLHRLFGTDAFARFR